MAFHEIQLLIPVFAKWSSSYHFAFGEYRMYSVVSWCRGRFIVKMMMAVASLTRGRSRYAQEQQQQQYLLDVFGDRGGGLLQLYSSTILPYIC